MKLFNFRENLIKWRKIVEYNSTSTQPETNAVNFEILFDEIKYNTFH